MQPVLLLLAVAVGCAPVAAGPAVLDCWFVQDAGRGRLEKKPAALLLRPGEGPVPPRPDLGPEFYLQVHDPAGALRVAFQRVTRDAPAPHCEVSHYVPLPASAPWAAGLAPERSCPRALDGTWYLVSVTSQLLSLSSLLRLQPRPSQEQEQEPGLVTVVTAVLTVFSHTPKSRVRLGQDAVLDLSFAYAPPSTVGDAPAPGVPPFGLEWRRQHLGKGHLVLASTPGLKGSLPRAQDGAVTFAAWDDDEPWGPWTGNGTLVLPAIHPSQEGSYLATVHLPYLQGQVTLDLAVQKPPTVSLMPAPLVWAAPGEAPPELVCHVSQFYPPEGLEVEWELRGGPGGAFQKAEGQRWLSALRHHADGSVSLSGHLQPPPVTLEQHGVRYACRVRHRTLPTFGRSAAVTLEVAGLSGPSLEDGVGLFLSAFLLLGLLKALGWVAAYLTGPKEDLKEEKEKTK
ncbi:tapasin [Sorex fumeus]|uniref:tapasin n=1 Tax=Sorex fumeus TaxID=62283 RepID=UPI0024AE4BBC|nr:tapasin [Sorex fumeus]